MEPLDLLDDRGHIPEHKQAQIAKALEEERVARQSQAAVDAMPVGRERDLVLAIDEALSRSLGGPGGYIPSLGAPMTARLKQALAAYGITPDYGAGVGGFPGLRYSKR